MGALGPTETLVDFAGNPISSSLVPAPNGNANYLLTEQGGPGTTGTATLTSVLGAASDTSLLAANTARKGAMIYNDSTATLYLCYGAGPASVTVYSVQIPPQGYFELYPSSDIVFTGQLRGIWSAAAGNARITELS